jgi:hypothetical protein
MKQCEDMADFRKKFDRAFNNRMIQKSRLEKSLLQAEKGLGQLSLFQL